MTDNALFFEFPMLDIPNIVEPSNRIKFNHQSQRVRDLQKTVLWLLNPQSVQSV